MYTSLETPTPIGSGMAVPIGAYLLLYGRVFSIYIFVLDSPDPSRKLIVYALRSIWSYPFFKNDINRSVYIITSQNHSIAIELPIEVPIELPIPYWTGPWAGPGPGPDRLGLKCYLAWGGTRVVGGRGGAKGPRPDPLGFRPG